MAKKLKLVRSPIMVRSLVYPRAPGSPSEVEFDLLNPDDIEKKLIEWVQTKIDITEIEKNNNGIELVLSNPLNPVRVKIVLED